MTDAEKVAAIERAAELELLPQLLEEARRRVPPPPTKTPDPLVRIQLQDALRLIAEAIRDTPCDVSRDSSRDTVTERPAA